MNDTLKIFLALGVSILFIWVLIGAVTFGSEFLPRNNPALVIGVVITLVVLIVFFWIWSATKILDW
jgi:hypothetical protein